MFKYHVTRSLPTKEKTFQERAPPAPSGLSVRRYNRHWAVYENGRLLCVALYKKGALAVMRRMEELLSDSPPR